MFFEVKGLCFSHYKKPLCLKDVSFSVEKNSKTLILASNGMGKTSLLKVISGFETSRFGSILLENKEINKIDDDKKWFSLILSDSVLFEGKSIKQNIDFQCDNCGIEKMSKSEIYKYLNDFKLNRSVAEKVKNLSLLEKRKLQIIRSLIKNPVIMFLDDQFDGLSESEIIEMQEVYKNLINNKNLTVIATIGDKTYKKLSNNLKEFNFSNLFYLNFAKMYEFKNFNEFEDSCITLDVIKFINDVNLISGYIEKDKNDFWFCIEEKRLFKFKSKFNALLNKLNIEFGEIEECYIYFKDQVNFENLASLDFNKLLENRQIFVFSKLTGERLI